MDVETVTKTLFILGVPTKLRLLYFGMTFLQIFGCGLCCFVAYLFYKFGVNHVNFATIITHILLSLAVNNLLQLAQTLLFYFQLFFENSLVDDGNCMHVTAMPPVIALFMLTASFFMLVERAYATANFARYEHEDYSVSIGQVFGIVWVFIGLFMFFKGIFALTSISKTDYYTCLIDLIQDDPLKTNWQILLIALFMLLFCVFFCLLHKTNVDKKTNMTKPGSTYKLSYSYQLRENTKSMRIMVWYTSLLLIFVSFHLYEIYAVHTLALAKTDNEEQLIFRHELSLLFLPLFTVIMPLIIIKTSDSLKNRIQALWRGFFHYQSIPEELRRTVIRPPTKGNADYRYFDSLSSYWESKKHTT
uniref:Uncharacterized protein n=1 Tax=Panagrolaimus sp. JU765 TaxID=591449 RepID=A0AC34PUJ2_9BILA